MSDKKICDYCGEQINDLKDEGAYAKIQILFYNDFGESHHDEKDVCWECFIKGVTVKY